MDLVWRYRGAIVGSGAAATIRERRLLLAVGFVTAASSSGPLLAASAASLQPQHADGGSVFNLPRSGGRMRAISAKGLSVSLLQSAATVGGVKKKQARGRDVQEPLAPGFFGPFSEGESTYDAEAEAKMSRSSYSLRPEHPNSDGGVRPSAFFHESKSGGPQQAFQTHYPALNHGIAGRGGGAGAWNLNGDGQWVQDYRSYAGTRTNALRSGKAPGWFESGVSQFDGYGRERVPDPDSVRWKTNWTERTVNTTLQCATSGCTARSSMQLFNPYTEEASNCHFSLHLHPTDFDDQYSGERLTFISVNGVTVNTDCYPMISGCNETTKQSLFPCLQQQPVDHIMQGSGTLTVAAQISDVVDECPYEGNMLSGVPMVTCLVRPRLNLSKSEPPAEVEPPVPQPPTGAFIRDINVTMPLRCMTRGCSAETELQLNRTSVNFSQCLLSVKLFQTDFDNEADTFEGLEFLSVDGETMLVNATPGGNPCRSAWNGTALSLAQIEVPVLSPTDVTSSAADGIIRVGAKISRFVDECAHDGYLLNGMVEVRCSLNNPLARPASPSGSSPNVSSSLTF